MGERDAFGREKSENTLADMGWSSGSSPQISAEPAPAVERPATPPSAMEAGTATTFTEAFRSSGLPRVQRRRVRPGRFIALGIIVAIAGARVRSRGAGGRCRARRDRRSRGRVHRRHHQGAHHPGGTAADRGRKRVAPPPGRAEGRAGQDAGRVDRVAAGRARAHRRPGHRRRASCTSSRSPRAVRCRISARPPRSRIRGSCAWTRPPPSASSVPRPAGRAAIRRPSTTSC